MPPDLIATTLALFLALMAIPAGLQLRRAIRDGCRARVGRHGVQFAGALAAAALLLWGRR